MAKLNLYIILYIIHTMYNIMYKFNFAITRINYILEYIKIETLFLNCNNILDFWSNKALVKNN